MKRSTATITLIVSGVVILLALAGLLIKRPPAVRSAIVYPEARELPDFVLVDHLGAPVEADRFRDGWNILFFGFTHCPDICPTTLYELSLLRKKLADLESDRLPRIWLVSVDPERDTPAVLGNYLESFGDGFAGITGQADQVKQLAGGLGVAYRPVPDGDDYTMSHTAALFLVDQTARLVALFTAPHDMEQIARDYRVLTR